MSLQGKKHYSVFEKSVAAIVEDVIDKVWVKLKAMMTHSPSGQKASLPEVKSTTATPRVITTRRGLRIVVNDEEVCFYGQRNMIRADWAEVPGIVASLRCAIVPHVDEEDVSLAHVNSALELATGFAGSVEEYIFTVGDAEDIVKERTLLSGCPNSQIKGEIKHVMLIGSKKLYRYIEKELRTE